MKISHTVRFGNVVLKEIECDRGDRPVYSDGKSEGQLLEKLRQHYENASNTGWMTEIARKDFVFEYHLSPIRHNLLKWFPFTPSSSLLDIGCGCGALTGLFAEKVAKVTALEYSPRRAEITALRHKTLSNLQVFVGGIQDFAPRERYNYISIIGVLEYAPTFFGGPSPQATFLRRAADLLEPDGALIIAIENKIGLKYLSGAPEDHTGIVFDSIYDYPHSKRVRTFSKKELAELLDSAGFHSLEWFYPFPDYKFPRIILSDYVAPHDTDRVWKVCADQTNDNHKEIISEKYFGRTLARAGLLHEFANSFLVVARRKHGPRNNVRCLKFAASNTIRKPQFQLDSLLVERNEEKILLKRPATSEAADFLYVIAEREQRAVKYFGSAAKVVTGKLENDEIHYPLLPFPTLEELIVERLRHDAMIEADAMVEQYCQFVRQLPSSRVRPDAFVNAFSIPQTTVREKLVCLNAGPIDLIPANILVAPDWWYLLDHEWFYDFPVPVDFVKYRGLATLVTNAQDFIQANAGENPVVLVEGYGKRRTYMPMSWFKMIEKSEIPLGTLSYWNWCFQAKVLRTDKPHRTRWQSHPRPIYDVTPLWTKVARSMRWHKDQVRFRYNRFFSHLKRKVNRLLLHYR